MLSMQTIGIHAELVGANCWPESSRLALPRPGEATDPSLKETVVPTMGLPSPFNI